MGKVGGWEDGRGEGRVKRDFVASCRALRQRHVMGLPQEAPPPTRPGTALARICLPVPPARPNWWPNRYGFTRKTFVLMSLVGGARAGAKALYP